ncbi:hypothetical protein ACFSW8_00530 [Rubritalea tangerina]|uniref:Uncharacterized protein n=2 Tax=Rubritalea tangerina TaxID=430798 RepID=A0ABW4Z5W6_9BACT
MTSCYYPPYEPQKPNQPVAPPAPKDETVINDEGQRQLEEARQRLENNGLPSDPANGQLPTTDPNMTGGTGAPAGPTTYPYASKVPGKQGFVFNPYTKNQVDVRGIPSGTLVRDPYDSDKTHKFRVP